MQNKRNISYISHTHWDREWYRSSSEFKVRLYATVKKVIETLESDDEFQCFTFDGQYQMIEEALEVDDSLELRLKNLVEQGRVLIGPWYIQPDMNLVDGESIANNLRIGIESTVRKFGKVMNVLWNPDTFFQSGNTPFFVNQFGLDGVYAWRNFATDNLDDFTFIWEGENKERVRAITFPLGYGYFRYLNSEPDKALASQVDWIKQMDEAYPNHKNEQLLMGGSDHATIQEDTPQLLKQMSKLSTDFNFIQSTPETYLNNCNFEQAQVFTNQPISYRGGRIHPGIGGSRMDIKQLNVHHQHAIAKILSPIVAMAHSIGGYENSKMIDHIWKNLLKNQFHDSIYTSSPEKVNEEVYTRYKLNEQMIDELMYLCSRYIIKNTIAHDQSVDEYIVVYNTLPMMRVTNVEAIVKSAHQHIKVLNGETELRFSYQNRDVDYESKDYSGLKSLAGKYQLDHTSGVEFGEKYEHVIKLLDIELAPMSYTVLKVEKADSDISVELKTETNLIKVENSMLVVNGIPNFISLENILDNGDSYNFSTNEGEQSKALDIVWRQEESNFIGEVKTQDQDIKVEAYVEEEKLKLKTIVENSREDNTLSLVFNFNEQIETATNLHYAHVKNDSYDNYKNLDWKKEEFKEKPLPIYLFSRYLDVNNKWTIISNDITQFYQNDCEVKFTLLRSYGRMGELDLPYRPGRASGYVLDTPSSQQKKKLEFNLVVDFKQLDNQVVNECLVKPYARFILPTINESKMKVPQTKSLFKVDNSNVLFETFKVVTENSYALRFSNPTIENQVVVIDGVKAIYESTLLEGKLEEIKGKQFVVGPNNATTIIVEMG